MAIARSGTPTTQADTSTTKSHVINKPSGVAAGDVCCIGMTTGGAAGARTWPSGFTEYGGSGPDSPVYMAYKKLDGTEGSSFTVATVNSVTAGLVCCCYSGCDSSIQMDATPVASGGTATSTPAATGISTVTVNTMLVSFLGCNSSSTVVSENDAKVTVVSQVAGRRSSMDDGILSGTGPSGNVQYSLAASRSWGAVVMALRPSAVSAAGPLLGGRLVKRGVLQGRLVKG